MMNARQVPALTALCVLAGLAAALLAGFGSPGTETAKPITAKPIEDRYVAAPSPAEFARAAIAMANAAVVNADVATRPALVTEAAREATAEADKPATRIASALPELPQMPPRVSPAAQMVTAPALAADAAKAATAAADQPAPFVVAALPDPSQMPRESEPVPTTENTPEPAPGEDQAVSFIDILDECFVLEVCVDHYLFALYERTAKQDTSKVHETRKVKVWRKGKTVTVRKRYVRLVPQDFTWKDPIAAERAGMPMMDYVIGGMDRGFKLKLFHTLRAAEKDGLAPGITSGFRDDYRQSIASGQKAAANRSYHGGSLRGGYGRGMAADVVSVKGATRAQRWVTTEVLWKWIDANEKQFGVGRPYLNRDPPHVAPIDGEEYTSRRGTQTQTAQADVKKPARLAARSPAKTKNGKIVRAASAAPAAKQAAPSRGPTVAAAALKRN